MRNLKSRASYFLVLASLAGTSAIASAGGPTRAEVASAFKQNCVSCHTGKSITSEHFPDGISLEKLADPKIPYAKISELGLVALLTGKRVESSANPMPPSGMAAGPKKILSAWAANYRDSHALAHDQADAEKLAPVRKLRRLTAFEYPRVIRDLFHQEVRLENSLPDDPVDTGFDNDAEMLGLYQSDKGPIYVALAQEIAKKVKLQPAGLIDCANPNAADGCAAEIIARLGLRALRRPLTSAEIERYAKAGQKFAMATMSKSTAETPVAVAYQQVRGAIAAMLASPKFVYRKEVGPALSAYELASRLSFLIWSSTPDDALLKAAANGSLLNADTLEAEMRRMFADQRSDSFFGNFGEQWLGVQDLTDHIPDAQAFPGLPKSLQTDMLTQTEMFLESVFKENLSVKSLLDADFTWVNASLAKHYSLASHAGGFQKISLPSGSPHRGILGLGAFLMQTSAEGRTSPTRRGASILNRLVCDPVPPPPPGIAPFPAAAKRSPDVRAMLAAHAKNPACSSCHSRMDPLGLTLQNFNGVGQWLGDRGKALIDDSGKFHGAGIKGVAGLREALERPSSGFEACFTKKLMAYAIGHALRPNEESEAESIASTAAKRDVSWNALMAEIIRSQSFRSLR